MNDTSLGFLILLLIVFLLLSAFFSSAETGIMTANRYKLKHKARTGNRHAKQVLQLLAKPDRLIGVVLVGNTVVNISAASVATLIGLELAGDTGVAVATGVLTFVLLIFGELGPKTFAANHPEKIAYPAAWILTGLLKILLPLVWLVNATTNLIFRLDRMVSHNKDSLSPDELRTLVLESSHVISHQHRNMLLGVLNLDDITVNDIMIPRQEVAGVDLEDDLDDIVKTLRSTQHTRLPVFRGELNDTVGIMHIRNATRFLGDPELTKAAILQYVREPYYVPEGTPLLTQLLHFQKQKRRFGLVVDEYGDVQGVVTLEDILEEIVGEFTTSLGAQGRHISPQPDGTYLIDGSANIRDINRLLHWTLPTNGPRTLNGLILEHLETIPESALSLKIDSYCIEIVQTRDNAVRTAKVSPPQARRHATN